MTRVMQIALNGPENVAVAQRNGVQETFERGWDGWDDAGLPDGKI